MIALLHANALSIPLASGSVQCVITSPPYWGKRDYGVKGQLGMERTPEAYTANLVEVFREVWRVLKPDGVVWLNLGDTYFQGKKGNSGAHRHGDKQASHAGSLSTRRGELLSPARNQNLPGLKAKDLVGLPWMVAFALRADGWYLRSEIIWSKPNPMPESVEDRPTVAHEQIFLLTKSKRYYYDWEAIREPAVEKPRPDHRFMTERKLLKHGDTGRNRPSARDGFGRNGHKSHEIFPGQQASAHRLEREDKESDGFRNKRSVWCVPPDNYDGAHFATFPPKLVEPMLLAGSAQGDLVLDPFAGTATVGRVAIEHRRRFVGLELNPAYIALAEDRTSNVGVRIL